MSDQAINNEEFPVSSPGAILKRCREYHGISLDEAADATKIGKNYLSALEDDRIKEFASIAYLKGFLRIYASHIGLNADDMVRLFERLYEPESANDNNPQAAAGDAFPGRQRFQWRKLALPAFLLLLLVVSAIFINRKTEPAAQIPAIVENEVKPPPVQQALSTVSIPLAVPANKDESEAVKEASKAEVVAKEPVKDQIKTPAAVPKAFVVRMKAVQNCKLAVVIDGATTQHYDLSSGDIIEWKAEQSMGLEVSNAGGVEAQVNGKPLNPFGPAGKPVYVVLDAEGVKK